MRNCVLNKWLWLVAALFAGLPLATHAQTSAVAGMQVLTRGPVHEAFAESSMGDAVAGVIISRGPPAAIAEMPPDQRPDGGNVAWIPGYWSWDDDRNDYIWVSGVWRDLPPGRQWIPGYWATVHNGTQWISGFWGDIAQTEVVYLPPPPASLDSGPNSPMPGPNNFWSPGCWVWQQSRYDWQPGYWVVQQPDWVWAPAHYTWTPRGHIYVPGYWDRALVNRGVMFAPVYYEQPIYTRSTYVYSPRVIIDIAVVAAYFFVQPRSRHYYYGDYYDRRYEDRGFRPWYSGRDSRHGYDSNYAHYRSRQLERDAQWDQNIVDRFRHRRDNVDARPPRTLDLQVNIFNNRKADAPRDFAIGRNLSDAIQSKDFGTRFRAVDSTERERFTTRGQEVRKFQMERQKSETTSEETARPESDRGGEARAARWQMRQSPVAAQPVDEAAQGKAPPPAPRMPTREVRGRDGNQDRPTEAAPRAVPAQRDVSPARIERGRTAPEAETAKPGRTTRESRPTTAEPRATSPKGAPRKSYQREAKPEEAERAPARVSPRRESQEDRREATPRRAAPTKGIGDADDRERKGKRGDSRDSEKKKRESRSGRN